MNEKGHNENIKKYVVLRLKMDNYEASICKTSWISTTFGTPKSTIFLPFFTFYLKLMELMSGISN